MKKKIGITISSLLIIGCTKPSNKEVTINCKACYITKQETALKIAEAILVENYGEDKIESEKPFNVKVFNDTLWNIRGSFNKIGFGGVFDITLSAKNGRVVKMYHEK